MNAHAQADLGRRWLYSAKPASWPKLLLPCVLGQWLGVSHARAFNGPGLVLGLGFTCAGLLFIVWLNDVGDQRVDAIKRQMFPDGCSPKTIPDGILSRRALLGAALAAGCVALACAALGAQLLARPALLSLGVFGMLVFSAYSLPPLRLNYRGGGELLEMLGAGVVLPTFNLLCQAPWPGLAPLWPLGGFALLCLSSALASGLSDEVSDRAGGKATFTTLLGNAVVRRAVQGCAALGFAAWLVAAWAVGVEPGWPGVPLIGLAVLQHKALWRASEAAVTNAFAAQAHYKRRLHRLSAQGTLLVAAWYGLASFGGGR